MPLPMHIIIRSKWENLEYLGGYKDDYPGHCQSLMGSSWTRTHLLMFFFLISSICLILLTNKQTSGHESNISLVVVITETKMNKQGKVKVLIRRMKCIGLLSSFCLVHETDCFLQHSQLHLVPYARTERYIY